MQSVDLVVVLDVKEIHFKMGSSLSMHIGPYMTIKERNEKSIVTRLACNNTSCRKHGVERKTDSEFCSSCGTKLSDMVFEEFHQTNVYHLCDEDTDDNTGARLRKHTKRCLISVITV